MINLLIDTDVALGVRHEGRPRDIDDGFALVAAMNSPDINLLGITCVFGNAPLDAVTRVAQEIVSLKGRALSVAAGAAGPLTAENPLPPVNAAVIAMAQTLEKSRCHIAAIGPLTNIALLIEHYPGVLANIESIIAVAGRSRDATFYLGDSGPVRDFNFESDVPAAEIVMASGLPLVLAGFELTSQVVVTEQDLETIARSPSPTALYFYDNSLAWCRYWTREFPVDAGFHPWDSAAISWLRHPEYFTAQPRGWRIRFNSEMDAHWLECDSQFPGKQITYLTGFAGNGAEQFTNDVMNNVY